MEKLCLNLGAGALKLRHVIATKFQPGEWAGISAWAEIRYVITPLATDLVMSGNTF